MARRGSARAGLFLVVPSRRLRNHPGGAKPPDRPVPRSATFPGNPPAAQCGKKTRAPIELNRETTGTLPEAEAVLSAVMRTRRRGAVRSEVRSRSAGARAPAETPMRLVVHRAVREPVDGEADTVGARSAAVTSRREARGRRSRPGRARRAPGRAGRVALPRGDIVTRAIEAFGEYTEASDRRRRGA